MFKPSRLYFFFFFGLSDSDKINLKAINVTIFAFFLVDLQT